MLTVLCQESVFNFKKVNFSSCHSRRQKLKSADGLSGGAFYFAAPATAQVSYFLGEKNKKQETVDSNMDAIILDRNSVILTQEQFHTIEARVT